MGRATTLLFAACPVLALVAYGAPVWMVIDLANGGAQVRLGRSHFLSSFSVLSLTDGLDPEPFEDLVELNLSTYLIQLACALLATGFSLGLILGHLFSTAPSVKKLYNLRQLAKSAALSSFVTLVLYIHSVIRDLDELCETADCSNPFRITMNFEGLTITFFPFFIAFFIGVFHTIVAIAAVVVANKMEVDTDVNTDGESNPDVESNPGIDTDNSDNK